MPDRTAAAVNRRQDTRKGTPIVRVTKTDLEGVLMLEPQTFRDPRGLFLETYHRERYVAAGIDASFVQDNYSWSKAKTLRGLHYQLTRPQGKLVTVVQGSVFDVVVDVRKGSPTFGRSYGVELSSENMRQLYIPPGYAHGFCVLTDEAGFFYKCTDFYRTDDERGVRWDDPALKIAWPLSDPIISAKDRAFKTLAEMDADLPAYR